MNDFQPRDYIAEPELLGYVRIILRRWWLIALTTVLAAVPAYLFMSNQTPIYLSSTTLKVARGSDPSINVFSSVMDGQMLASTYVMEVTAPSVMEAVEERLKLDPKSVGGMVSAGQVGETHMIQISVRHPNPSLAQAVANATAEVFIEQQMASQRARYEDSLQELEAQVVALESESFETLTAIAALGDVQNLSAAGRTELARLQTDLMNRQTRLSVLLSSTEQFRLAMTRYGDYIEVFSPAEMPMVSISPQLMRNTMLAAVVGAMIGVGTLFLLDYLDDTVHNPQEVKRVLGIETLAAIPELPGEDSRSLVVAQQPLHPVSEAFRSLRTSIQFANLDRDIKTLMITSPLPSEGKSFVAANLAAAIAQSGRRVVLVEADLRHPTVHRIVGLPKEPGLTETLTMLSEDIEATWRDGELHGLLQVVPGMDSRMLVMTSGGRAPNPAEILGSGVFSQFLDWLRDHADIIVIDTPPVMSVTDAVVVGTQVDAVALVAEAGYTKLGAIQQTFDRLGGLGIRVLGLIVNRLSARSGGYYYHYYHSYPYGDNGHAGGNRNRRNRFGLDLGGLLGFALPAVVRSQRANHRRRSEERTGVQD